MHLDDVALAGIVLHATVCHSVHRGFAEGHGTLNPASFTMPAFLLQRPYSLLSGSCLDMCMRLLMAWELPSATFVYNSRTLLYILKVKDRIQKDGADAKCLDKKSLSNVNERRISACAGMLRPSLHIN